MADISFACPNCKQVLEAPDDMAGQGVECPACHQQIMIPSADVPASKKCPSCDAVMEADAVLCLNCGFHTKLGKKINTSLG